MQKRRLEKVRIAHTLIFQHLPDGYTVTLIGSRHAPKQSDLRRLEIAVQVRRLPVAPFGLRCLNESAYSTRSSDNPFAHPRISLPRKSLRGLVSVPIILNGIHVSNIKINSRMIGPWASIRAKD